MKRIAIISSFAWIKIANNYGALFQYYALQQYLLNKGHYAFWIRYILNANKFRLLINSMRRFIKNPRITYNTYICHLSFMKYCKDYLNLSEDIYTEHNLDESYPLADYYITGSDQVWGGTIPANYLCFVKDNNKKIAYAASFGRDEIGKEQLDVIAPWIRSFARVSVRECSGVNICKSIGSDAVHLLDPTLLLDADKYPHADRIIKKDYLFCYFLNVTAKNDVGWNSIVEYAKDNDKEIKVCAVQGSQYLFDSQCLVYPTPVEWLTYYRDANAIITNTFHGSVFAIIHHKPFVCVLQKGASANQNTRMISLLKLLGLENRITNSEENILPILNNRHIDWGYVESLLEDMRKRSNSFLTL